MKTLPVPVAPFGRTAHMSTRVLFGAAAFFDVDQKTADRTMDLLSGRGINHIDTAASYGKAEILLGPWLKHNRKTVFLATKTEKRTRTEAREELHRSLDRMQVDSVDLWQMHVLIRDDDWETAMGEGGALEAFVEARDEGLVKWLGVTGHETVVPRQHLRSLERFDFDTVLLPWNWMMSLNAEYVADFNNLRQLCRKRGVAFQLIKTLCHRPWAEGEPHNRATWYKPLEDQEQIDAAIHWAMGVEEAFINSAADVGLLPKILDSAASYSGAPSDSRMTSLAQKGGWQPLFT